MRIACLFAFAVSAAGTAANVALYVADTSRTLNLAAAVFCGAITVWNLATAVTE